MIDSVWVRGRIVLNDDTELNGLVQHNEATKIVYFKTDKDSEEQRSFRENRIASLIYKDPATSQTRQLYSFAYRLKDETEYRYGLFEVLLEFKSFAILSRKNPLNVVQSKQGPSYNADGTNGGKNFATILSQVEVIYIADEKGELAPYLVIEDVSRDGLLIDYTNTKRKILDKKLIQKHIGDPAWEELQMFAKENKLKFDSKDDLLKILEHYKTKIANAMD